jgi:hypothetical protein
MHGSCALLLSELNVTRFEISATFPPNWRYLSVNKRYISPIKRYKTRIKRYKTRTIASRLNHLAKSFEIRAMPAGRPAPERPWGGRQLPRSAAFSGRQVARISASIPSKSARSLLPRRCGRRSFGPCDASTRSGHGLVQAVRPANRPSLLAALAGYLRLPRTACAAMVRDSKARILAGRSQGFVWQHFQGLPRSLQSRLAGNRVTVIRRNVTLIR